MFPFKSTATVLALLAGALPQAGHAAWLSDDQVVSLFAPPKPGLQVEVIRNGLPDTPIVSVEFR